MTKAELEIYRQRLLALKKRYGGELSTLEEQVLRPIGGEASGGLSDVPLHLADLGTDTYEQEIAGMLPCERRINITSVVPLAGDSRSTSPSRSRLGLDFAALRKRPPDR